jgi:uncharacterized protein (TIGR02058 family)
MMMRCSKLSPFLLLLALLCACVDGFVIETRHGKPMTFRLAASNNHGEDAHVLEKVLFIECGFGSDAHGQDSTKAAVRACRNAIEFNQIPCIAEIVPGGRSAMKLNVLLAVPPKYQADLDLAKVKAAFPYGQPRVIIQDGGMIASNGKAIESLGDTNEDMVVVCVAVTVGY